MLAFNGLQLEYSQEARPYSMLVLGCTLSVALWHRLVVDSRRLDMYLYVITTVLTLYAHYLAGLTIIAQAVWWIAIVTRRPSDRRSLRPLLALVITGALCIPLAYRYLHYRSSMFQGLEWISTFDLLRRYFRIDGIGGRRKIVSRI